MHDHKQAQHVLECIRQRLEKCRLTLRPEKTKVVYCKDGNRRGEHDHTQFDFLGYTFRARSCKRRKPGGRMFVGFTPAVSQKALKSMNRAIRGWKLKSRVPCTIAEIAKLINPVARGWMNYYGAYCRSALGPILRQVEQTLAGWASRKYKKLHRKFWAATRWLRAMRLREHGLFVHWAWMNQNG